MATDSKLSAIRCKQALDATGLVTSAIVISPPETREGHEDTDETKLSAVQAWWKENVGNNEVSVVRVFRNAEAFL